MREIGGMGLGKGYESGGGREVCGGDEWFSTDSAYEWKSLWLALGLAMTDDQQI